MEVDNAIFSRRAVRKYKPDPIPEEKLQKLYKALQAAPTANNSQPFKFIFVKDAELRRKIVTQACHQDFLLQPPVLVVAVCNAGTAFDAAIAVDHMSLTATSEGLGTCWIGWYEKDPVKKLLSIPAHQDIAILMPVGYPDESPAPRARKPVSELITVL